MATIQRSLLVEASADVCYAFWCDFKRFPDFLEDVSSVLLSPDGTMTWERRANGDALPVRARVIDQVQGRTLSWQFASGPERAAILTFAPLAGEATWFTFALEYDSDQATGDVAGRLNALSRRLDRELRTARDLIEARAFEEKRRAIAKETCN